MQSLKITAVLLVVGLFAAGTSAEIIDPANITGIASSEWWQGPAIVSNFYDGSGMDGDQHIGIHYPVGGYATTWGIGNYPVAESVQGINDGYEMMGYAILSFDKSYPLERINIWNVGGAAYALGC